MPSRQLSTRQQRFACARLPDPHLTRSRAPFPRRSRPSALSRTPLEVVWSLPPQGDPRGPAILHLLRSTASSKVSYPIRPSLPRSWRNGPRAVILPAFLAARRRAGLAGRPPAPPAATPPTRHGRQPATCLGSPTGRRRGGDLGRAVVPTRRPDGRDLQDRGRRQHGPAAGQAGRPRLLPARRNLRHHPRRPACPAGGDGRYRRGGRGGWAGHRAVRRRGRQPAGPRVPWAGHDPRALGVPVITLPPAANGRVRPDWLGAALTMGVQGTCDTIDARRQSSGPTLGSVSPAQSSDGATCERAGGHWPLTVLARFLLDPDVLKTACRPWAQPVAVQCSALTRLRRSGQDDHGGSLTRSSSACSPQPGPPPTCGAMSSRAAPTVPSTART